MEDVRWAQGYLSRRVDPMRTRVEVAHGRRKGELYVDVPSWESTQYHNREYLKKGITFEDRAVGALFWVEDIRYRCTEVSGDTLTLKPTVGLGAPIQVTIEDLVKSPIVTKVEVCHE